MSVRSSFNWTSQQRVDVPHLRSEDSGDIYDFQTLLNAFVSSTPYILTGFTIPVSGIGGPATALQVVTANSIVWNPSDTNGPYLNVPGTQPNEVLSPSNANVVGSFSAGINYIGVQFTRAADPATADLVAFWDTDSQTEFTQTIPLGLVLNYQIVISNIGFGSTAPIAIVNVSGSNVTSIENCKQSPFRLGTGGANPNIAYSASVSPAIENPLVATSNSSPDPFAGGDWELDSFKQWSDLVMTQIKNITGSAFWYAQSGTNYANLSLTNLFFDTVGSTMTGTGQFLNDSSTPGLLSWSTAFYINSMIGPLTFTVNAGSVTLTDTEVAYLALVRNQDFQPANTFTFTNGSATITGSTTISGISAGDYIKYYADDMSKWGLVSLVSGNTITLSSAYTGTSTSGKALRTQGTYAVQISTNVSANADNYWLARRMDNGNSTPIIYVRFLGLLESGESHEIADDDSLNLLAFCGSTGLADSNPNYSTVSSGSLNLPNYNGVGGESLTVRLSKVTAMLADTNQSLNLAIDPGQITWNGTNVTINNMQLSIPAVSGATPINTFSGALASGSALYVNISRTTNTALTLSSAAISSLTPAQQQLILVQNVGGNLLVNC